MQGGFLEGGTLGLNEVIFGRKNVIFCHFGPIFFFFSEKCPNLFGSEKVIFG